MRSRAAVFVLHDVVSPERLDQVPSTHRPYALVLHEFRALMLAASHAPRRSVNVSQIPGELGGGFFGLTFDDGHASNYGDAFPVLRELGLRATFFVVPTLVETPGYVTWAQLREMVAAGMEVGSHSLTHPFLPQLDRAGLEREFGVSKAILEERLGAPVRAASLPRGWPPPTLEPVLEALGYRVFCTSRVAWWHPGDQPLAMPRVAVRHGMGVEEFSAILNAETRSLWRQQALEAAKNAAKACLGIEWWQRLRAPLLARRYGGDKS
jgi:peptidoglycan/xylan/chitin deacetylase (PgdA/CDA1 family)